jgi:hypothetical protein
MKCGRLPFVNLGQCSNLRTVGHAAFSGCVRLRELEFPRDCQRVDAEESGIADADLRGSYATFVTVCWCALLRRLILPTHYRGDLWTAGNVSFASVTLSRLTLLANPRRVCGFRSGQIRFASAGAVVVTELTASILASDVLGEVAALHKREGRPSCPP